MTAKRKSSGLPDEEARRRIREETGQNFLVEAAAGTGKTTGLVARMVTLAKQGEPMHSIVAVTFTRKAAAEMRARFQAALEKESLAANGKEQEHAKKSLEHIEHCYIGTIHSFCARLLRERPVEAGVDVAFQELDEDADAKLLGESWCELSNSLYALRDPLLARLEEHGIRVSELEEAFREFATYPDVEDWPRDTSKSMPLDEARKKARERLQAYAREICDLATRLPEFAGNDKLIPRIRRFANQIAAGGLDRPAELAEALSGFTNAELGIVQYQWPGKKEEAKRELERWGVVCNDLAPLIQALREHAYPVVLEALQNACDFYKKRRAELGALNFQDLLLGAARLLKARENEAVRHFFKKSIQHVLVDEFQDTDPIQAEVLLLLTADDPQEKNWRKCRPRPGSLFVVGDPKQSIYRFRRADIATYGEVKKIISTSGGEMLQLTSNFRSLEPLTDWVNATLAPRFPPEDTIHSPAYVQLHAARKTANGSLTGLRVLEIPEECCNNKEDCARYEAELIAQTIRDACDRGLKVALADGTARKAQPGDFMILTRKKEHLGLFAQALQNYRIPCEVTGSATLNETPELRLLSLCVSAAAQPDDPVALVAALRSELFGVSDDALYRFHRAGGEFNYKCSLADSLSEPERTFWDDHYRRFRRYAAWLAHLPPVAAFERIAADLGLFAAAAAKTDLGMSAGSLAKALELLRLKQAETFSPSQLAEYLEALARLEKPEARDGMAMRPFEQSAVRVMNLHKAKGLEAPVVFLAGATGDKEYPPKLHVDRSADRICGYLEIRGPKQNYHSELLAIPPGWEKLAEEETKFQDAEETRLLYVAATRAGAMLVVSSRAKTPGKNPWFDLANALPDAPKLEAPKATFAAPKPAETISLESVNQPEQQRRKRWEASLKPTFASHAATTLLRHGGGGGAVFGPPDQEAEWGTVIHLLLQTAMSRPDADLRKLALSALADAEIETRWADEAVKAVELVRAAPFWQRAQKAARRLTEVPFQSRLPAGTLALPEGPPDQIVSGVIDLAFRDSGGWVLVDYKTGIVTAKEIPGCIERYRAQVDFYASVLSGTLGEPVVEKALFMIPVNEYYAL